MLKSILSFFKKQPKSLILILLLSAIPVVLSGVFARNLDALKFLNEPGMIWLFCFVTIFTMAFSITPTILVSLLGGFFYGWIVFPGLAISYMCSAAIGFYMGRWVKLPRLRKRMEEFPKADLLLRKVEQNDFLAIVFSRISPLFPFAVTNFLLSSLNIKFSRYMWANFVGMLPRTILVFYSGIQAKRLSDLLNAPNEMGWAQWATPLFILVSLLGFIYLLSRKANKFYKD
ncbi:MAG: putative membrane protein YdjX (TVP38/TMEM64 family) [Sphingobacteriales bacterium]|jgi:uncharacterized membrane protein YdjX (TVP38/TMEM64 family)